MLDEVSGKGISGVKFTLAYIPADGTAADRVELSGETDQNGRLRFTGLPKGSYTLTEVYADGYDISQIHAEEHLPFIAEFVIDDDDFGGIIEISQAEDKDSRITVKQGQITEQGITNARLLGSVTLYKLDGDDVAKALNGAEFTLYKLDESTSLWQKIKAFVTGGSYTALTSWDGQELNEKGKLRIDDLDWGTYKLVETKAADGYSTTDKATDKALETIEFTIDRESEKVILLNTDGNKFYNYQTSLTLTKINRKGELLKGAEFALKGTYVDKNGKTVTGTLTGVTDSDGLLKFKGVLIGGESYTLSETAAPRGYDEIADPLEFTVKEDGTIVLKNKVEGYTLTSANFFGNRLKAVNERSSSDDEPVKEESRPGLVSHLTLVQTGDDAPVIPLLIALLLSFAAIVTVIEKGRKRRREK